MADADMLFKTKKIETIFSSIWNQFDFQSCSVLIGISLQKKTL